MVGRCMHLCCCPLNSIVSVSSIEPDLLSIGFRVEPPALAPVCTLGVDMRGVLLLGHLEQSTCLASPQAVR